MAFQFEILQVWQRVLELTEEEILMKMIQALRKKL